MKTYVMLIFDDASECSDANLTPAGAVSCGKGNILNGVLIRPVDCLKCDLWNTFRMGWRTSRSATILNMGTVISTIGVDAIPAV